MSDGDSISRRDLLRGAFSRKNDEATSADGVDSIASPGQVARIETDHCLAWQGTLCSVCREQCPEVGAIEIHTGRPIVIEDRCTGCNVCREVCPAPVNAVRLVLGGTCAPIVAPEPPGLNEASDGKPDWRAAYLKDRSTSPPPGLDGAFDSSQGSPS